MPRRRRTDADEVLLLALACGATVESAAQKAGISRSTAQRRLADAAFRQRVLEMRADMVQRTAALLTAASMESVKTLLTLQTSAISEGVRLRAAQTVLDVGMQLREASDWEQRQIALERRVKGMAGA